MRFVKCCEWRRGVIRITPSNSNPTSKANTSVTSQSPPSSSFSYSSFSSSSSSSSSSINFESSSSPPPLPKFSSPYSRSTFHHLVCSNLCICGYHPQHLLLRTTRSSTPTLHIKYIPPHHHNFINDDNLQLRTT